jgi:hypothetical protein
MKHLLPFLLIALSLPLGVIASLNIYFIVATMGSSSIPAPTTTKYALTGALVILSILLFLSGLNLIGTKEKS